MEESKQGDQNLISNNQISSIDNIEESKQGDQNLKRESLKDKIIL